MNFGSGQTEGKNNYKNCTCDHGIKFNVKVQALKNNGSLRSLLILPEMVTQKQSLPSFVSVLSLLSIVFYCAGFLRVELELNEQKKRINALENNGQTEPRPSFEPSLVDLPKTKKSLGKFVDLKSCLFVYCLT